MFISSAEHSEDTQTALRAQANIIGIDPGIAGALALVSGIGDLIDVADMPVLRDSSGGRGAVNAPLLAKLLARWPAREAVCEFVSARPKEGAVGAFSPSWTFLFGFPDPASMETSCWASAGPGTE
jgi:hypothetical protein